MPSEKNREETIKNAVDYLNQHNLLTMATATLNGEPDATALEYANDNLDVIVSVRRNSRKVKNISENPRVFYEIHDETEINYESVKNLKALQVSASVEILTHEHPLFNAKFDIMQKKFPVFERIPREKRTILLFKPKKLWFLNYREKMFHRDEVIFED